MRKKDRAITDPSVISDIIRSCKVCHLGLARDNEPYIVPISFGYDGEAIYIHTAVEGKKIDFFGANDRVCVAFERDVVMRPGKEEGCSWSVSYQSVIGQGVIREIPEEADKQAALDWIMQQYSDKKWEYSAKALKITRVWKISFDNLTGKQSKDRVKQLPVNR